MSSSTSKSPKSTCIQSNSSWNSRTLGFTYPLTDQNQFSTSQLVKRLYWGSQQLPNLEFQIILLHWCPNLIKTTGPLVYSDQSSSSTETRNWISPQTTLHSATIFYYTMSTQTLDGKPQSWYTAQYKLTCGCLPHPVNTDSVQKATIRTYIIQEALTACLQNQHKLWTETTILTYIMQEDLWPLATIQHRLWTETTIRTYKIQEDLWPLVTIQVAEFRLKLPNKGGRYHLDIKH